jgi:integrase/recombinase XerD
MESENFADESVYQQPAFNIYVILNKPFMISDSRKVSRSHERFFMLFINAIKEFNLYRNIKVKKATVSGNDLDLRQLCVHLRNPDIKDIKIEHITQYLNSLLEYGWDKNSMIGKAVAYRQFFKYFRLKGESSLNEELIPIPEKEYKLPRVCTQEIFNKLISVIPRNNDPRHIRNLALIYMYWDTGARNEEILGLNIEDLDLIKMEAIIKTEKSKGKRPFRMIFWDKDTNDYLKAWIDKREHLKTIIKFKEDNALFISVCGKETTGRRLQNKGAGELLRRYSLKAGLETVNAHSFRHHKGHAIIKQGGSSADVMNFLGHASVQSTTIYTMMAGDELRERRAQLQAHKAI